MMQLKKVNLITSWHHSEIESCFKTKEANLKHQEIVF